MDPSSFAPFLPYVGIILAGLALWASIRAGKRHWLVDCLPTSKVQGVFIGLVEVKGTAESAQPLTSYLGEQSCVWYSWTIDEHWSRTVTETYTDSEGRTRTRTRHESGWTNVAKGGDSMPFYLQDDTGNLLIRPEGAEIDPEIIFKHTCGTGDPLYYGKGPSGAVMNSDYQRQFVEKAITLRKNLYVIGQARERQDIVAPEIAADPSAPMYMISVRTEEQISSGYHWKFWIWGIVGAIVILAGLLISDRVQDEESQGRWPIYAALWGGYLFAWLVSWLILIFNSFVATRQRVRQGWAQVDIQLKRRHDLIPNLVATVTGFRDYEKETQETVAQLRAQSEATPPGQEGSDYEACAPLIQAVIEKYPALKSSESFLALQKELADTEQRIALARAYYNDIATFYNTRLEIIPEGWIARLGGFQPEALMQANGFERAPVEVSGFETATVS